MIKPDRLITSSRLARNLATYIQQAKEEPLFVQKNGIVEVVLLSYKEYERLKEGDKG